MPKFFPMYQLTNWVFGCDYFALLAMRSAPSLILGSDSELIFTSLAQILHLVRFVANQTAVVFRHPVATADALHLQNVS